MDRRAFAKVEEWTLGGHRIAMATVVSTWKSSPRRAGSVMLVRDDGQVFGSVSGGCVEAAVIDAALASLKSGRHALLEYGPASPDAVWEVGLSCGGGIRVLVEPCPAQSPDPSEQKAWRAASELTGQRVPYVWMSDLSACPVVHSARRLDRSEPSSDGELEDNEGRLRFDDVREPAERLVIVGGVHIAVPLVAFAKTLGFETAVIEPRATFADPSRFEAAPDEILAEWPEPALERLAPDAATYAVAITHDPKIDDPALVALLRSDAPYVGVLGSKTTHAERLIRLRALGFDDDRLGRLRGPVGLAIGAQTPEEIALSIMAEIIQVRRA